MEFILIKEDSTEWNYMWEWLANHPINQGIDNPSLALNEGEGWAYMGSWKQGQRVIHTLRHRYHPATEKMEALSVEASKDMNDEMIEPKNK